MGVIIYEYKSNPSTVIRSNLAKKFNFWNFVNPIMRKAAPLIISSESNLAEGHVAVGERLSSPRSMLRYVILLSIHKG